MQNLEWSVQIFKNHKCKHCIKCQCGRPHCTYLLWKDHPVLVSGTGKMVSMPCGIELGFYSVKPKITQHDDFINSDDSVINILFNY